MFHDKGVWKVTRPTRQPQLQGYIPGRLQESFVFEELELEFEKIEEFKNCDAALETMKEWLLQGFEDAEIHREFPQWKTKAQMKKEEMLWTSNHKSA